MARAAARRCGVRTVRAACDRAARELRLAAIERRVEADLALGRHAELIGELTALVAASPLRERLRGQLMLALYRSGRQAEALAVYSSARTALVDELGIEPGPVLRRPRGRDPPAGPGAGSRRDGGTRARAPRRRARRCRSRVAPRARRAACERAVPRADPRAARLSGRRPRSSERPAARRAAGTARARGDRPHRVLHDREPRRRT